MKTTDMIEASKMVGGTFRLTALLQRRVLELMHDAPPLVKFENKRDYIEIALQEVLQGKITLIADLDAIEQDVPDAGSTDMD